MKFAPFALAAAALVCGNAIAQAPSTAERADNRAKAARAADKATPGPAERARNRSKAAELADKATPDAGERAQNRSKVGKLVDKATPDASQRARNRAKAAELASRVTGRDGGRTEMGAAGDGRSDGDRRQRMDQAYADWQRQQGSR